MDTSKIMPWIVYISESDMFVKLAGNVSCSLLPRAFVHERGS